MLTIDLIPQSCWYKNVRSNISKNHWTQIRKYLINNKQCPICKSYTSKFDCHEIFLFDDNNLIQYLIKIIPICKLCHLTKHYGFADMISKGKLVFNHLKEVNNWNDAEANSYLVSEFNKWEKRSKVEWHLDLTSLLNDNFIKSILKQYET